MPRTDVAGAAPRPTPAGACTGGSAEQALDVTDVIPRRQGALKRCPSCGVVRPVDDFWRNTSRYDGCSTYCKICGQPQKPQRPRAMLPAEPLLDLLREATGERGNRGSRTGEPGVHRLAARMATLFGGPYDTYRVQIDRILRGSLTRIHFTSADRFALALGRHPAQIWGTEW